MASASCSREEVKILPTTIDLGIYSLSRKQFTLKFRDPSPPKIPPKERRILSSLLALP